MRVALAIRRDQSRPASPATVSRRQADELREKRLITEGLLCRGRSCAQISQQEIRDGMLQQERLVQRQLATCFRSHEEGLRRDLGHHQARVELSNGGVVPRGRNFAAQDRSYIVAWNRSPACVSFHLRCLRGVKDKLPAGTYVFKVSLYDHLAGAALQWSQTRDAWRWNGVSACARHGGGGNDVEISFDQSLRLLLPAERCIAPSMVWIFELHQVNLAGVKSRMVGWGAFPICDSEMRLLKGKYKAVMLAGPIDPTMDTYRSIQTATEMDLNTWLCNVYFEIDALQQYDQSLVPSACRLQMHHAAEMFGLHNQQGRVYTRLLRAKDVSFEAKYDAIVSKIAHRKSCAQKDGVAQMLYGGRKTRSRLDRLRRGITTRKLSTISGRAIIGLSERQLIAMNVWAKYRHSVAESGQIRGFFKQIVYLRRELQWELINEYRVRWRRIFIAVVAFVIGFNLHHVAQWAWLTVVLAQPTAQLRLTPLASVTYDSAQMTISEQVGSVVSGVVANIVTTVLLVIAVWCCRILWGGIPQTFSEFVDGFCLHCISAVHNVYSVYNIYSCENGDGLFGLFFAFCLFIILSLVSCAVGYVYFIHLHGNGRIDDLVWRLTGSEKQLAIDDREVSLEELKLACVDGHNWARGGARRRVVVMNNVQTTQVSIEHISSDFSITPLRAFCCSADSIMESTRPY